MAPPSSVATNLHVLFWQADVPLRVRAEKFAEVGRVSVGEAKDVLGGRRSLRADVAHRIAEWAGVDGSEILLGDLAGRLPRELVIRENLNYLIRSHPSTQKALAASFGVDEATVSKWLHGKRVPSANSLARVAATLGVRSPSTLEEDPHFLTGEPIGVESQRRWIIDHIRSAPSAVLQRHFASIRRLLLDDP